MNIQEIKEMLERDYESAYSFGERKYLYKSLRIGIRGILNPRLIIWKGESSAAKMVLRPSKRLEIKLL